MSKRYVHTLTGNVRYFTDAEIGKLGHARITASNYIPEPLQVEEPIEEQPKMSAKEKIQLINEALSKERVAELAYGETRKSVLNAAKRKNETL